MNEQIAERLHELRKTTAADLAHSLGLKAVEVYPTLVGMEARQQAAIVSHRNGRREWVSMLEAA